MNKFSYLLPSGKRFTLTTPATTTRAQADRIFYQQVAAGTLVAFAAGQSISNTKTTAVKFALSRLDRGTAGVEDRVILSIVNSLPAVGGVPNLLSTPLENPITQADLANINFNGTYSPPAIGPLNSNQVQGLLAQIANYIDQPADTMSNDKGVGLYGLDCQQLEQAGYVKPGTYREFIFDPSPLTSVVSAPGIWTGKNGIGSVTDFLFNPASQSDAMTNLMTKSYNSLTATGTIVPPITQSVTALAGQVYTQSGLQTISQLSAATGIALRVPSTVSGALANTNISKLLSSSITDVGSLASGALNNAVSGAFSNVSAISSNLNNTITGGVSALVTNGSIFGTSATTQWAKSGSLDQLISGGGIGGAVTGQLGGIASNLTGQLGGLSPNLTGGFTSLTNNIQGLNVLGKASQFASGFSNPFNNLSNLGNFNLSSLTSGIPNIAQLQSIGTDLTNSLTGSLNSLTDGISGSLTSLTSSLEGTLGSLTDSLGGLTSSLSGSLGSLTDSLGSFDLGSLSSLGDFGNLANFADLGSLGDLGGLFGGGGDALVSSTQVAAGFSNTVNRSVVDTAFVKILGNPKIPVPDFDYPSANSGSQGSARDIAAAQTFLASSEIAENQVIDQISGQFEA
jgi:hypothetical protein